MQATGRRVRQNDFIEHGQRRGAPDKYRPTRLSNLAVDLPPPNGADARFRVRGIQTTTRKSPGSNQKPAVNPERRDRRRALGLNFPWATSSRSACPIYLCSELPAYSPAFSTIR